MGQDLLDVIWKVCTNVPQPISVSSILDERVIRPLAPFAGPLQAPVSWLHRASPEDCPNSVDVSLRYARRR